MGRKVLITIFIISMFAIALAFHNLTYEKPDIFYSGEQLVYKVKYLFLRVGTLRLVNEGLVNYGDGEYFKLRIYIDSASGVPFVNIHDIYESYVDSNAVPTAFYAWEKKGDYTLETDYLFYNKQRIAEVKIRKVYSDHVEVVANDTIPIDQVYRDVVSLLYFARQKSSENYQNITIPTFVLNGRDSCYFNEVGNVVKIKYNKQKYPCYYIQGRVKFIGIAGIKDDFQGWFSVDRQRVPLKAKMKAFFGSINIELEDSENWLAKNP